MNNFVTDAINLKAYNLSEADKIIVMYSKDKGQYAPQGDEQAPIAGI